MKKKNNSGAYGAGQAEGQTETPKEFSDNWIRCKKCYSSKDVYGFPDVHTPMVIHTVHAIRTDGVTVAIGKATRCGNSRCDEIADVRLSKSAERAGITKAAVYNLLRASGGNPVFTIKELKEGRLAPVKLSDSLTALLSVADPRPQFGRDYNPDEHIEPAQPTFVDPVQEVPF